MANEFIIKNGFYSNGNSAITGSLIVSASVTGNDLQVGTNKLVVSASGNVGIGTTTPTKPLVINTSVNDPILINNNNTGAYNRIVFQKPAQTWSVGPNNDNAFSIGDETVSVYRLTITSGTADWNINTNGTGSIGIGVVGVPSAKVHINNRSAGNSFLVEDDTNPDTTPFVINTSGSVGIGTLSPQSLLHIKPLAPATSGQSGIVIESNAGTGINLISDNYNTNQSVTTFGRLQSSMAAFLAYAVNQTGSNTTAYQSSQDAFATRPTALELGNGYFALKYNTSSISRTYGTNVPMATSLYLDGSSGRLGIGTQTPQAIFQVSSSGYNESYPFIVGFNQLVVSSSGTVGIGITVPSARLHINNLTSANSFLVEDDTNPDTTPFVIDTSGSVGIGKLSPNTKLDINGNTIITGSLTVTNDFTVLGSSSIQYITSSQLNIADNIISVNTINPAVRFGGLAVIDSGSSPQTSGSLLFDSQNNQWIHVHQSAAAAAITSSVLIMGPQTFNNVGSETTLTANRLPKAISGDLGEHISDSNISDTGTIVSINSNTQITGSLIASGGLYAINTDTNATTTLKLASTLQTTTLGITNKVSGGTGIDVSVNGIGINGAYNTGIKTSVSGGLSNSVGAQFLAYNSPINTGAFIQADGPIGSLNYAVQLQDGTEAAGKVLVSQDEFGNANWSTQLSGSYGLTGSLNVIGGITGSGLLITGSTSSDLVRITQTGTGNAFVIYDVASDTTPFIVDSSGSVGVGLSTAPSTYSSKLYVTTPEFSGWSGIKANGNNNHAIIGQGANGYAGIYGENADTSANTNIGVYGKAYQAGDPFIGGSMIGGKFEASGDPEYTPNYSVQLKDGTEAIGKVLVSQDASGSANWSTRLSGSYEITGSLKVTGNLSNNGSTIDTNALIQAGLLYLSNNF
jgi:hypothetical protein